jgi:hypothetical protein
VLLLEGVIAEAGGRRVLDGLDLAVRRGERFGVVGNDRAALRTLFGLLTGRQRPTAGRVRVDGLDPVRDAELLADRMIVEVLPPTGGSGADRHALRPALDATASDVRLVLDERAVPDQRDRDALVARFEHRHLDPHRTVLLATSDHGLATAVCGRVTVLTRGRATTPVTTTRGWATTPVTTRGRATTPVTPHGREAAVRTPSADLVHIPTPQATRHLEGGTS